MYDGTGYCAAHADQAGPWRRREQGTTTQRGYGHAWRKKRNRILWRDKHLCQLCLANYRHTQATDVDHITPKARGGSDDDSNLQSLCTACHKDKTARESNE